MLARLEAIEGVDTAEVDHRGAVLRLTLSSSRALDLARQALRGLGYAAEALAAAPDVARWYGRTNVRDLSREEADIIARRVVTTFARTRGIGAPIAASLQDVTARALYATFEARAIDEAAGSPGTRRDEIATAVEIAAREVIGDDAARALAAALCDDLDSAASSERPPDR